jgi:type II secretory ATPase GspE/PulE/Tfp pilus assembly ATPase PilB-like protein
MTTGYRGRTAVYEVVFADREIRELIRNNVRSSEIAAASHRSGSMSLFAAGVQKVREGKTTLAEVRRVLFTEE